MTRKGCCKNFNGVQNKICEVGIAYDSFPKGQEIPCLKLYSRDIPSNTKLTCEKYEDPSDQEIAAYDAMIKASMERFSKAGPLIRRIKTENKGKNWRGVEVCPACGGRLHMSHAAYNGHVHGKCETSGCLAWME